MLNNGNFAVNHGSILEKKNSHVKPLVNIIPSDLNLGRVAMNKIRIEVAVVRFLINTSMNHMF